jgi:valyl-tRNA synthetase
VDDLRCAVHDIVFEKCISMSSGNVIYPIKCIDNVNHRTIPLLLNSTLQFKSRIINGNFTRGYSASFGADAVRPSYVFKPIYTGFI